MKMREKIARAIDPGAWDLRDELGEPGPAGRAMLDASLDKADAVIDAFAAHIEGMRQKAVPDKNYEYGYEGALEDLIIDLGRDPKPREST